MPFCNFHLNDYSKTALKGTPILANMTEFGKTKLYTINELAQTGVAMVLYPRNPDPAIDCIVLSSGALFNLYSLLEDALFCSPMKSHWYLLSGVQSVSPQSEILFFPKSCFYRY